MNINPSQLVSTFFGLTSDLALQLRKNLFTQIHDIVFHGNGGYDWLTIYNMPIWLRKFTFSTLQSHFKEEKKQFEESQNLGKKTAIGSDGKIHPQSFTRPTKSNYK